MQLLLPMLRRRRSRGLFCCWFVSIPPFLASTTTTLATASSSLALFTTPPPPPPPLQQQRLLLMFSGHFPIDLIQKINRLPFGRTRTCNPPLRPFSGSTTTATANDPRQRQRKWFQANTGSFETDTDADEDAEQHSHPHPHQQHYVFGYGSLICPASRSITNPTLSTAAALPVAIRGLQRAWSARTPSGYTAVGVVPTTGSTLHHQQPTEAADDDKSKVNGDYSDSGYCTGVLLRVPTAQALDDLDRREAAYHRRPIRLSDIRPVPMSFLTDNNDQACTYNAMVEQHPVFVQTTKSESSPTAVPDHENIDNPTSLVVVATPQVWVYIPKQSIPADASHPIPQSYVDVILRGCLTTLGPAFARSFVRTTTGWQGQRRYPIDNNKNKDDEVGQEKTRITEENDRNRIMNPNNNTGVWVNDRSLPLYKRADAIYSARQGGVLDALLAESMDDDDDDNACLVSSSSRHQRSNYDPVAHLEALTQAALLQVKKQQEQPAPHVVAKPGSPIVVATIPTIAATATETLGTTKNTEPNVDFPTTTRSSNATMVDDSPAHFLLAMQHVFRCMRRQQQQQAKQEQ